MIDDEEEIDIPEVLHDVEDAEARSGTTLHDEGDKA